MKFIASNAVRNRLINSLIEYGLNGVFVPVGNATADAILSMAMEQIDRECGRKTMQQQYSETVLAAREEYAAEMDEKISHLDPFADLDNDPVDDPYNISDSNHALQDGELDETTYVIDDIDDIDDVDNPELSNLSELSDLSEAPSLPETETSRPHGCHISKPTHSKSRSKKKKRRARRRHNR